MSRLGDAIDEAQASLDDRDPRIAKLERLAAELRADGIEVAIEDGKVCPPPLDKDNLVEVSVGHEPGHTKLGIVSDTHLGSKWEQLTSLRAFYRYAVDEGVDCFLHGGDWLQGLYKKRQFDQQIHAHGADAQVDYAAAVYPDAPVPTKGITGNHDDTFYFDSGVNVLKQISAKRPDIEYLGQDSAYVTVNGLRCYIVHPDGGGSYAKSYKPQKVAEALPKSRGVQACFIGHYHTYGHFEEQGMQVFMLPSYQGQYPYLVRKNLYPTIGGLILDIYYDDERITRLRHELVTFRERANDWDMKVSGQIAQLHA